MGSSCRRGGLAAGAGHQAPDQGGGAAACIDHEPGGDGQSAAMADCVRRQPLAVGVKSERPGPGVTIAAPRSHGPPSQPSVETRAIEVPPGSVWDRECCRPTPGSGPPHKTARGIAGGVALVLKILPQSHVPEQPPGGGRKRFADAANGRRIAVRIGSIHAEACDGTEPASGQWRRRPVPLPPPPRLPSVRWSLGTRSFNDAASEAAAVPCRS